MKISLKYSAAVAITAALIPLAGCGASNAPIKASADKPTTVSTSAAPVIAPDKETGQVDVCANNDASSFKISGELAATFTQAEVADAACTMLRTQYQVGWTNLAVPGALKASKGQAATELLRPWMTEFGLNTVDGLAVKAATGEQNAMNSLAGLTEIAMTNPDWDLRAVKDATAPIVGDRKWSKSTVALDQDNGKDGAPRLDVTITFTDQMLLSRKSDRALGSIPVTREVTYAMSQTSLKDHPWLIDSWSAKWEYGTPSLDKTKG